MSMLTPIDPADVLETAKILIRQPLRFEHAQTDTRMGYEHRRRGSAPPEEGETELLELFK